jgi:hypothetical protein
MLDEFDDYNYYYKIVRLVGYNLNSLNDCCLYYIAADLHVELVANCMMVVAVAKLVRSAYNCLSKIA